MTRTSRLSQIVADAMRDFVRPRTELTAGDEQALVFSADDLFESSAAIKREFASADSLIEFVEGEGYFVHAKLPIGWRFAKRGHFTFAVLRPEHVPKHLGESSNPTAPRPERAGSST